MAVLPRTAVPWHIALPAAPGGCGGVQQAVTSRLASDPSARERGQPAGAGTGQDGSCSSADITHSCDGNSEPFYKELRREGNCFSFHAR